MKRHLHFGSYALIALYGHLILMVGQPAVAEPSAAALSGFNSYVGSVESRLAQHHLSSTNFLVLPQNQTRLRQNEIIVERLTPRTDIPGALLHHWRGTTFVPRVTVAVFEHMMEDFNSYPQHFSPQVLQARVLVRRDNHLQASMRVRERHVITVVMDATYDVIFARLDPLHGYSLSHSTNISEIDSAGAHNEHALGPDQEHGFLWRQNTYWSYEERDGGLYIQIESVSLSRSIPRGLGWAIQPFIESVPRESLEFTLRATCNALQQ